ncbi:hypothetical protein [Corynebacterium singulare]|uniref:DUF1634 domain-containing protein n=1 Tax=Corynebacterium singulare TaxID=161899 RepID=A0ABS9PVB8_9CORY|nr:hypothetical protein [Corynebacterium singulare]MCG7276632.1 hypothetical protein [Corynebacterium singulare]
MDQHSAEPNRPEEQSPERRRGLARFFNETLALKGTIVVLCGWAIGYGSLFIADLVGDDASFLFGFLGLFILIGLLLAMFVLTPLFAFLALAALLSDDPARKKTGTITLVLLAVALVPIIVHYSK